MKKILYLYVATLLLVIPGAVAQVDGALTRSGEVSAYDDTRADFLTVSGKLSRYPHLSRAGEELHYAPIVTTDSVPVEFGISNAVTVYGNILFNGWYETVTVQGFQLSTSTSFASGSVTDYPVTPATPYVECDQPCSANVFSQTITGLIPDIPYFVRAYATNNDGTTYGEVLTFIIYSGEGCPGTPRVTDHQGNEYTTVQIGYQCWTRQNMRCTTLPSGRELTLGWSPEVGGSTTGSSIQPYYYDTRLTDTITERGYLYNWAAAMDTVYTENTTDCFVKRRGICPEGWHVPSKDEWDIMLTYVMTHGFGCGGDSTYIANALSDTTSTWGSSSTDCTPGNDPTSNNLSEFSAFPANYYNNSGYPYLTETGGNYVRFWGSTTWRQNASHDYSPASACYVGWGRSTRQVTQGGEQKAKGFSVRCIRNVTGLHVPTLSVTAVDSITEESARVQSVLTADGGAEITERGICWGLDTLPTINNYRMVDTTGEGLGAFISRISNLTPNLTYHVRAYAINFEGVGYSSDVTFTTPAPSNLCPGTPTVTDHEGNVYNTVQIGYQCWTRENMRCTTFPDGREIGFGGNNNRSIRCGDTLALYYNDTITSFTLEQRGYMYNWYAAMDTVQSDGPVEYISFVKRRGICPEGWHVPSFTEWDTLAHYMSRQSEYSCRESSGSTMYVARALASKYGWNTNLPAHYDSCYVGKDPNNNNASGMTMMPVGYWSSGYMNVTNQSKTAEFWSSTYYATTYSTSYNTFILNYDMYDWSTGHSHTAGRGEGASVRCLRDTTGLHVPTVTAQVDTVESDKATFTCEVTNDGGETVTSYGLCYSTDAVPTLEDANLVVGSGLGSFTGIITGLVPNTTYYVRAYATNYEGTGYSEVMEITTPAPANSCPGTPTVTDHEGNVYNTVQIGDQCWTRENMRCVTTPKRPNDTLMTTCIGWNCKSNYEPHIYSAFNFSGCNADPSMLSSYGYFYNWPAAMDTVGTDDITASFVNRRGICPQGWHVPSAAEWDTLLAYVGRQEDYRCNNNSNYIARTLADQSTWNSYSSNCCPGADLTQNNATGFTAVAAGDVGYNSSYSYVRYGSEGQNAYFWSSTHYNPDNNSSSDRHLSYYYSLYYNSASVNSHYGGTNSDGYSVRCIKDAAGSVEMTNPTVKTTGVSEIGATSVKFTGEVVSDGNATVTERGFCWGANANNLDTNHTHAAYGTGEGVFEATVADFAPGYTYYMCTYAVNSLGITYGERDTFTMSNDFHVDVLPYVTDFSDAASWALNDNDNEYNCYWMVGTDNGYYAGQSLFVTRDGTTAGTIDGSYRYCYLSAEKFLKMPAGDSVHVEFDVLAGGYYDYHYMKAFLAPVSYTFTSGSSYFGSGYSTNAVDFQRYMAMTSNCYYLSQTNGRMLHVSVNMPNPAPNDTCKLAFLWNKSYYSSMQQPGAIVANVSVSTVSAATESVTDITTNSAKVYGRVSSFGSETVTERGVCWATHAQPTVEDNHLVSAGSTGSFNVSLTSLPFNTQYYVRAYAKTSTGLTVYGDDIMFRTKMSAEGYSTLPYSTDFTDGNRWVISNGDATNYWTMGTPSGESNSMLYITNDEQYPGQAGYSTSTSYTVVTAEKPLVMPASVDSVYVSFDVKVGGESSYDFLKVFLTPDEFEIPVYYGSIPSNSISHYDSSRYAMDFTDYKLMTNESYHPYIFNLTRGNVVQIVCKMANPTPGDTAKLVFLWRNDGSSGTQPGATISNLTVSVDEIVIDRSCPGTPTVTDEEGNTYGTVLIGTQCWMAESLRSTYRGSYTVQNVMYPNSDATLAATYGLLYQWADVMAGASSSSANPSGVQGLCPNNWHVPSRAEWSELVTTVQGIFGSSYTAKALAHKDGWQSYGSYSSYPSYQTQLNNGTGFGWRPSGCYDVNNETIDYYGVAAHCWTTTESGSSNAYRAKISNDSYSVDQTTRSKENGFQLRCVKD